MPKPTCSHCPSALCRTTRFDRAEVERAVKRMKFILQDAKQWVSFFLSIWPSFWSSYRPSYPTQQPIPNDRCAPIFENAKDENSMRQLLSHGIPFVVNGVKMRGTYDPNYFINKFYGRSCHIHYVNSGKVEQTTVEHFFRTFGDLRPSETRAKLKASFVVLSWISSLNVLAGLATGGSFPDWILGTIRGVYWRCSFPGHYVSQWGSQSRGTLSNKCSSPWLGYVLLILTGFLFWSLCFRAENV